MNFKTLILSALFFILMSNIMSAQMIKLESFVELTGYDKIMNISAYAIIENDFIYIRAGDFFILSKVKRKRKRRKGRSVDFYLKNKAQIKVYYGKNKEIVSFFAYHQKRSFFFDNSSKKNTYF